MSHVVTKTWKSNVNLLCHRTRLRLIWHWSQHLNPLLRTSNLMKGRSDLGHSCSQTVYCVPMYKYAMSSVKTEGFDTFVNTGKYWHWHYLITKRFFANLIDSSNNGVELTIFKKISTIPPLLMVPMVYIFTSDFSLLIVAVFLHN